MKLSWNGVQSLYFPGEFGFHLQPVSNTGVHWLVRQFSQAGWRWPQVFVASSLETGLGRTYHRSLPFLLPSPRHCPLFFKWFLSEIFDGIASTFWCFKKKDVGCVLYFGQQLLNLWSVLCYYSHVCCSRALQLFKGFWHLHFCFHSGVFPWLRCTKMLSWLTICSKCLITEFKLDWKSLFLERVSKFTSKKSYDSTNGTCP